MSNARVVYNNARWRCTLYRGNASITHSSHFGLWQSKVHFLEQDLIFIFNGTDDSKHCIVFQNSRAVGEMEDRSGGSCDDPTLSYTKDQILALRPPQPLHRSGRNGNDESNASSSQVINYLSHSSFSPPSCPWSPVSGGGQGISSWPPGLAAWVEQKIFPVLLPQQVRM